MKTTKSPELHGLIITRKEGDQIVINRGEIRIAVTRIRGKQVRLCFQAAPEISIQRGEVVLGLDDQKQSECPA